MAKEELDKLGFATDEEYERIRKSAEVQEGKKEGATGWLDLVYSSNAVEVHCYHRLLGLRTATLSLSISKKRVLRILDRVRFDP